MAKPRSRRVRPMFGQGKRSTEGARVGSAWLDSAATTTKENWQRHTCSVVVANEEQCHSGSGPARLAVGSGARLWTVVSGAAGGSVSNLPFALLRSNLASLSAAAVS